MSSVTGHSPAAANRIVLEAGKSDREYFKDLWRYRELFYVLAWRNVSVRYKQTAIGVAWAILRPALATIVFTVLFGKLGKFPSGGLPYPVLVLTGMLPWQLFSAAISESGRSLVSNTGLITKVYFPRLIIPGSALATSLIDFVISALMLIVVMAYYRVIPPLQIVCLPLFVALAMVAAGGVGIWVAALAVKYRDFLLAVPFLVQLGMYVSPVAFSSSIVPQHWRWLYALNPMVGVIDGFRWCLTGNAATGSAIDYGCSFLLTVVIAVTAVVFFRRTERDFADVI